MNVLHNVLQVCGPFKIICTALWFTSDDLQLFNEIDFIKFMVHVGYIIKASCRVVIVSLHIFG